MSGHSETQSSEDKSARKSSSIILKIFSSLSLVSDHSHSQPQKYNSNKIYFSEIFVDEKKRNKNATK